MLAKGIGIIQLSAGCPITSASIGGTQHAPVLRRHVGDFPVGSYLRIGIADATCRVARLVGQPIFLCPVGLVDELRIGGQSLDNLEQQIAVITEMLAAGGQRVVIKFVLDVHTQVVKTFGTLAAPIRVSIIPIIKQIGGTIVVVHPFVGRNRPRVGVLRIIILTRTDTLVIDAVDIESGRQPGSHVVAPLVIDVERTLVGMNLPAVVELVIQRQVALELVGTAAQRQVVLLQNLLLVDVVAIFLGKIVLLQAIQIVIQFLIGDFALCQPVISILNGRDGTRSTLDCLIRTLQRVGNFTVVIEEIIIPVVRLDVYLLFGSEVEVIGIIHVFLFPNGQVGGKINVNLPFLLRALGRDDNDTIGSPRTVNGRCGSILQDIDTFDVVRVQVFYPSLDRHAVHYQQRIGLGIQRTGTTNGYLAILRAQTSHTTFQVVQDIRRIASLQIFGADNGDRTCHFLLGNVLITGHDHFIQHRVVIFQGKDRIRTRFHIRLDGLLAQERNHHRRLTAAHARNGKTSVHIGNHTLTGSFQQNRGTDDRLSSFVKHLSRHGSPCLRTLGGLRFGNDSIDTVFLCISQGSISQQCVQYFGNILFPEHLRPTADMCSYIGVIHQLDITVPHNLLESLVQRSPFDADRKRLCQQRSRKSQSTSQHQSTKTINDSFHKHSLLFYHYIYYQLIIRK